MRKKISKLKNRHYSFSGKIGKVNGKSLLLLNVTLSDTGKVVTDHLWIPRKEKYNRYRLKEGSTVKFSGVPGVYYKGGMALQKDYNLTNIIHFQAMN